MSAQIKEALAALRILGDYATGVDAAVQGLEMPVGALAASETIRTALNAAKQEAEAREVIEQWINKRENDGDAPRYEEFPMFFFDGEFNVGFAPHGELYAEHTAKTLLDLAAWCRADLSK